MEICHSNNSSGGGGDSVDSSNSCLAMGRQAQLSPLSSANAFLAPAFNACIHPQKAFDLDPALLRYSRPSADGFLSPTMDPGKLIRHRHRLRSLSSSRGSSPSPLSPIENLQTPPSRSPPVFKAKTPPSKVVVGEEVLVMDGILVNSPSPTGIKRSSSTRTADSSGSSGGSSLYKTEICRSWEDSGICRYGTKCQFAHGKEELRPARHPRNKSSETFKSSSATAGACTLATKNRHVHQAPDQGSGAATAAAFMSEAEEMVGQALQLGPGAAESYIRHLLYGHSQKPRLPVFTEICAEGEANLQQRQSQLPDSFPIIM